MKKHTVAEKIEMLHDTVLLLTRASKDEEVYQITIQAAENILDYTICSLDIAYGNVLKTVARSSQIPDDHVRDFDVNEGVIGKTFREKRTIVCGVLNMDPDAKPVKADIFKSAISSPLGDVGVFQAVSDHVNAFSENDIRLLEILLGNSSAALDRIRLIAQLERLASWDPLTNTLNRYLMFQIITREIETARRQCSYLAFVMIDMNGLKKINDQYGHLQGDHAIKTCARLLNRAKRVSDILFRYGGDEFLLLASMKKPDLQALFGRIHLILQKFNSKSTLPYCVDISIGYAFWAHDNPADAEALIAKADAMMYEKKAQRTLA